MALSTQAQVLVKKKAANFLRNCSGSVGLLAKAFWMGLNQDNVQADLQIVAFGNLTGDTVVADAACKIYAIYLKKQNTATDCFFKLVDHATTAAGTTFAICQEFKIANDEAFLVYPAGITMSNGATLVSSTTDTGGTDSTSGDGPNGFVIIG